ncbi:MAG: hypothetical protein AAF495_07280 [Pseudomonadota bacterium]
MERARIEPDSARFRRSPETVMRLARMGSFHQTRLSFMRALLRRLKREAWQFDRPLWRIDAKGVGTALYRVRGPKHTYTLVAFGHDLDPALRSDRVIAEAWDATFVLFDGEPSEDDIDRLFQNVPKQEAGRVSGRELVLSRANRSVRLFGHVIESLAAGRQPERDKIEAVGYLMRTTAVYGSGKFGTADREAICDREEFAGPFRAEMLTVWLIRAFTLDLVEHMARQAAPETAVSLAPDLRRRFGVGNSTGLGMAPFLMTHPALINNWMMAREEALARVRALPSSTAETRQAFAHFLARAQQNAAEWNSPHEIQVEKVAALRADLDALADHVAAEGLTCDHPWDRLYSWSEQALSLEGQEQLVGLLIEPHGELVDGLTQCMDADEAASFPIDGAMTLGRLKSILEESYGWALGVDYDQQATTARFWYVSEEKLEPRVGERYEEPGASYEQPLATGRDIAALAEDLAHWDKDEPVAAFLLRHPMHRHAVRRAQLAQRHPYAEIRDNLIDAAMLPIDLLRCKLSFFGATKFDPRSDRWVRITMYQDAPFPDELAASPADDWAYPHASGANP